MVKSGYMIWKVNRTRDQVFESMHTLNWDQIHVMKADQQTPSSLRPLTELPLVIIVGLTGVGKTTTLELISKSKATITLLPNRRKITDEVIISCLQQEDGEVHHPITDRVARFEYTARYRATYRGGMAYALRRLAIDPKLVNASLIFDGLRGLNEITHAVEYFSQARFVVLDAPDPVRLNRLLQRDDAFDTTTIPFSTGDTSLMSALFDIPEIETVFKRDQINQIAQVAHTDQLSTDEVVKKVSIIVKERHNYDSKLARAHLTDTLPPSRVLIIDTSVQPAQQVATQLGDWLEIEV